MENDAGELYDDNDDNEEEYKAFAPDMEPVEELLKAVSKQDPLVPGKNDMLAWIQVNDFLAHSAHNFFSSPPEEIQRVIEGAIGNEKENLMCERSRDCGVKFVRLYGEFGLSLGNLRGFCIPDVAPLQIHGEMPGFLWQRKCTWYEVEVSERKSRHDKHKIKCNLIRVKQTTDPMFRVTMALGIYLQIDMGFQKEKGKALEFKFRGMTVRLRHLYFISQPKPTRAPYIFS